MFNFAKVLIFCEFVYVFPDFRINNILVHRLLCVLDSMCLIIQANVLALVRLLAFHDCYDLYQICYSIQLLDTLSSHPGITWKTYISN